MMQARCLTAGDSTDLAKHIRSDFYVRERLHPEPGDDAYLHLADLRLAMAKVSTERHITILDYGCGGSPYRSLFPNADYRRADFLQTEGDPLDYRLDENSRVAERNEAFDFVLSTQVLEHVSDPLGYLRECHRLLKVGGQLYLTTHGTYPDHGCPYDYSRWTAAGLVRDLRATGFEVCRVEKQTTGPRAFFLQCDQQYRSLVASRRTPFGLALWAFRGLYPRLRPWVHRMCDRCFAEHRVVTEQLERHATYAVVACLARKP